MAPTMMAIQGLDNLPTIGTAFPHLRTPHMMIFVRFGIAISIFKFSIANIEYY
jgi:hypothetical protein